MHTIRTRLHALNATWSQVLRDFGPKGEILMKVARNSSCKHSFQPVCPKATQTSAPATESKPLLL